MPRELAERCVGEGGCRLGRVLLRDTETQIVVASRKRVAVEVSHSPSAGATAVVGTRRPEDLTLMGAWSPPTLAAPPPSLLLAHGWCAEGAWPLGDFKDAIL